MRHLISEMPMNIYLEEIKQRVLEIFAEEDISIALFGSMAGGSMTTGSDVDVALIPRPSVDRRKLALLRETLEESNVPYVVEIVDFSEVSAEFREHALSKVIWWKR